MAKRYRKNFFEKRESKIEIGIKMERKIERKFKEPIGLKLIFPEIWKNEKIERKKAEVKNGRRNQKISFSEKLFETKK